MLAKIRGHLYHKIEPENCFIMQHIDKKKYGFIAGKLEAIFILLFFPRHTKLRISQDIC